MLSPKEPGAVHGVIFPVVIEHSALLETGFSSSGPCPDDVTVALGFKPAASTKAPLSDSTAHYALTIRKSGMTITAFKNAVVLKTYAGSLSPSTVAELVGQVLADLCGSTKGYYSRIVVVEGAHAPLLFWAVSPHVTGLYVPQSIKGLIVTTLLDFADASRLGNDVSGNGNHWVAAGVQTLDTPTNNYCTWNALQQSYYSTRPDHVYSEGNMVVTNTDTDLAFGTMWVHSGKWYWEYEIVNDPGGNFNLGVGGSSIVDLYNGNSRIHPNLGGDNVSTPYGESFASGDVMGVALDVENMTLEFFKNGVSQGVLNFSIVPGWGFSPYTTLQTNSGGSIRLISGSTGFNYTPPEGFMSLCAESLPDPQIMASSQVADVVVREGIGETTAITLSSMIGGPDFVASKDRDADRNWMWSDKVRGAGNIIISNGPWAEYNWPDADVFNSFDAGGYTVGANAAMNATGNSFLDLCLKAGAEQGFEIVTWVGDGTVGRMISHTLGKAPTFMIVRNLDEELDWVVYHTSLGPTKYLPLNKPDAAITYAGTWNNTAPTSTDFTVGFNTSVNSFGKRHIAYLFTDSDVFKAFSYTGNANVNGPFVTLDGKLLSLPFVKNTEAGATNWFNIDPVRSPVNGSTHYLYPNLSDAERSASIATLTSNGFKMNATGTYWNQSGSLYIGLAILESAQKYSNAF